jgi:hypothetical protein
MVHSGQIPPDVEVLYLVRRPSDTFAVTTRPLGHLEKVPSDSMVSTFIAQSYTWRLYLKVCV